MDIQYKNRQKQITQMSTTSENNIEKETKTISLITFLFLWLGILAVTYGKYKLGVDENILFKAFLTFSVFVIGMSFFIFLMLDASLFYGCVFLSMFIVFTISILIYAKKLYNEHSTIPFSSV